MVLVLLLNLINYPAVSPEKSNLTDGASMCNAALLNACAFSLDSRDAIALQARLDGAKVTTTMLLPTSTCLHYF